MSSNIGTTIKTTIFGESHGKAIGVVMTGLPAGEVVDLSMLQTFLARRAPGKNAHSTSRAEADEPIFLSGLYKGKTTGAPLCAVIENKNVRSQNYDSLAATPRPGHADYTAYIKYNGAADMRGGGHFSGRLTAPLCIAGGIALQILARKGIYIGAHIASIGKIADTAFTDVTLTGAFLSQLKQKPFTTIDDAAATFMQQAIADAKQDGDSIGGTVECAAIGLPTGLGGPMFDGLEGKLSAALFGIPAVKGVEFGTGFAVTSMPGSEANDTFAYEGERVITKTNHHGGLLGGITTGMPLLLRCGFKPTPSIAKPQQTVDLQTKQPATIEINGRHDPCIVPRAVPVVEAAVALTLFDALLTERMI